MKELVEHFTQMVKRHSTELQNSASELSEKLLGLIELEERSKAAEAAFGSITKSANDAIVSLDATGLVLSWNPAAERLFGYSEADMLGKSINTIIPARFHAGHNEGIHRVSSGGEKRIIGKTVEVFGLRRDGTEVPIELSIATWKSGDAVFYSGIIRDITQRHLAEQALRASEARFLSISQAANDAIISSDANGCVLTWNLGAERMFGYTEEQMLGKPLTVIIPERYRAAHEQGIARVNAGGERRAIGKAVELEGLRRDGTEFPIELSVTAWATERGNCYSGIIRDITARKAEQALRESEAAAREESRRLEDANRAKSVFLASMSHELRTPMNAIIGYSEMLMEDLGEMGNHSQVEDLKKIYSAGKHLLGLINSILDLSKIESGKMELFLEDFNARDMIQDAVHTVQPLIEKNSNQLIVKIADGVGEVRADLTKLRQTMFNIIGNASKFTSKGTIFLDVATSKDADTDWLEIAITDSGIGMTDEQMGRIFQPFAQADSATTRNFGGTGLGLSITKHFCEMMGGSIAVRSELGVGSTFTIRIPVRVGAAPAKPAPAPQAEPVPSERTEDLVLAIDDDPGALQLIERILVDEGYKVVTALSGAEGLEIARKMKPDMITLDVLMPGVDGWAVLKELKLDPELTTIPVIMISMAENQELGYSIGANEYLNKPVNRQQLSAVLRKYKGENVLVVDDDQGSRELMKEILKREGWHIGEAENGLKALEYLERHRPQLIILDLMMPGMNGFEFLQRLHGTSYHDIPVVVVSSMDLTSEDRQRLTGYVTNVFQKGNLVRNQLLTAIRKFRSPIGL